MVEFMEGQSFIITKFVIDCLCRHAGGWMVELMGGQSIKIRKCLLVLLEPLTEEEATRIL